MNRLNIIKKQLSGNKVASSSSNIPLNVLVTGAAGNIGYALVFLIAKGTMLGNRKINLHLLDIPQAEKALKGVEMELLDGAFPLVNKIIATSDYKVAFNQIDIALLVGARPRGPGMVRADLLKANAKIFVGQGQALNKYAKKSVKVVVVGNPANTNCLIAMHYAPSIPKKNFSALTRLDQSRAKSLLASKIGNINASEIKNVIIWGNHSKTQYPDVNHAYVMSNNGRLSIRSAINNDEYLNTEFIKTVQYRGAAIIKQRGKSSAASAANAVVDHVKSWVFGSDNEIVSMAICSDNNPYNIPNGLIYSFPVIIDKDGNINIVKNLTIDKFSRNKMIATANELIDEKKQAL